MKDLGRLWYFLGLELAQTERGILISQQKYTSDIIEVAALTDIKTTNTPLEFHSKLLPIDGTPLADLIRYRQLVDKLVYLCLTGPYIAHAVSIFSHFVSTPLFSHYNCSSSDSQISQRHHHSITTHVIHLFIRAYAYSDVDWANCLYTRRSTTGFYLFLGDSLISWQNKKHDVVSCSSCETEFGAITTTIREIVHVMRLLADFGVFLIAFTPLTCDNQSAVKIATVFCERTKHIKIDRYFTH